MISRRLLSRANDIRRSQGAGTLGKKAIEYALERVVFTIRYWNTESITLEPVNEPVTFDTSTRVAKEWFLPRYDSGTGHEPVLTRLLLDELSQDSVFYDVGANVGYFTALAAVQYPDAEVHAFELDEQLVEAIDRTLKRNGTTAKLNIRAVSDSDGDEIGATRPVTNDGTASVVADSDTNHQTSPSITLDTYCERNSVPDVIKVDVEGYEQHVLNGGSELLDDPALRTIFIEVHPEKLEAYGHTAADIISTLEGHGFDCEHIDHRSSKPGSATESYPSELRGNTMLHCVRESS